ncbi:response regulator transcription factor [Chryseolinea soli]|uniref:DNA-binding response regulator n=1 Tax=Chryseolinea soli TaxID=2321403 RepID=A0A385SI38_9BACT|nr:response regulator transcription factor [Chryseolinea soli]AYB30879.1 DNA-binding response regulator [Chryseolinea soli]
MSFLPSKNKLTFLLAEDDRMVREGFKALLEREPMVASVVEAGSGDEVLAILAVQSIDIILLDAKMPGVPSMNVVKQVVSEYTDTKIIVVSGLSGTALQFNLLRAGIHGFVQKLNGFDEVRKAIDAVIHSNQYFPPAILKLLQENFREFNSPPPIQLTDKEFRLLRAIVDGLPTKRIAEKLNIAMSTCETNRSRLLKKTGTQNTAELIAFAYNNGLI